MSQNHSGGVGPNEACPCGSGRRYGRCCARRDLSVFPTHNGALIRITPDGIRRQYPELWERLQQEARARGLAPGLRALLEAPAMREQVRLAKALEVTATQFTDLVRLSGEVLGMEHRIIHTEHVPQQVRPTQEEKEAFWALRGTGTIPEGPARKFTRRVTQTFRDRSQLVAHIFSRTDEWHSFMFEMREAVSERESGWAGGTHMHFVSHLWPGVTQQQIVDHVEHKAKRPRTTHIRFMQD